MGTLGLEFPAVLRPLEGDAPYRMTADVGTLNRAVDGEITVPRSRKVCVPPARVGKTGLLLHPEGGRVTLRAQPGDRTGALNVPAWVSKDGRFEFTDAEGGMFYGRIEDLRVTGDGLTVRIGAAVDGPKGGLPALARALKAQGFVVASSGSPAESPAQRPRSQASKQHRTQARSSVVCSGDGILCVVYSASQGRSARRSELGLPRGLR